MAYLSSPSTEDVFSSPGSRQSSPNFSTQLSRLNAESLTQFSHLCVLLRALNETYKKTENSGYSPGGVNNDKSLTPFQQVLNKLAQACDTQKGGSTVTALACLNEPDGPELIFCSNSMKPAELDRVQTFLTGLIGYLAESPGTLSSKQLKPRQKRVLWHLLEFGVPRIKVYLMSLKMTVGECIKDCPNGGDGENSNFLEKLRGLQGKANFPYDIGACDNTRNKFLSDCETLLKTIWQLKNSSPSFQSKLDTYASQEYVNAKRWCQLRHLLGRLFSYRQAADVLIKFSNTPENLEMLKKCRISHIPSAKERRIPISPLVTAKDLARVGFPEFDAFEIEAEMNRLNIYDFDENIRKEIRTRNKKTMVHAEIQLHHHLIVKGKIFSSHFWESSLYIATSKPPCRFCQFYFNASDNDFQVQPSSMNLYLKWRLPDLLEDCDVKVLEHHEDVMATINEQLQEDILDIIQKRYPIGKDNDSLTNSHEIRTAEHRGSETTSNDTRSRNGLSKFDGSRVEIAGNMGAPQYMVNGLSKIGKVERNQVAKDEYGCETLPAMVTSQPPSTVGTWEYINATRR